MGTGSSGQESNVQTDASRYRRMMKCPGKVRWRGGTHSSHSAHSLRRHDPHDRRQFSDADEEQPPVVFARQLHRNAPADAEVEPLPVADPEAVALRKHPNVDLRVSKLLSSREVIRHVVL